MKCFRSFIFYDVYVALNFIRFFLISSLFIVLVNSNAVSDSNRYAIVVDGGSTGSRAFIYHFSIENNENKVVGIEGQKVTPGISSFSSHPEDVVSYIFPILLHATTIIPEIYYKSTDVYIKATAGMRLLSETKQNEIYDALLHGLQNHPNNPFKIQKENIGTIDGKYEAYYAVLASNYIIGRLDTNLRPVVGKTMVGALDMGGSSTQLIFHTGTKEGEMVTVDDFWSHSWLSYGVDAIREKVWHFLAYTATIKEHHSIYYPLSKEIEIDINTAKQNIIQSDQKKHSKTQIVALNPCVSTNYEEVVEYHNSTVTLRGSGDPIACEDIIRQVLWPEGACLTGEQCSLDGIQHPPVGSTEFFAMSVYFYALDCIRHLSPTELSETWPNPTIDELQASVHEFCKIHWDELSLLKDDHRYTRASQMAHRCLQGLYLGVLLEDAFGFDGSSHRGITLALEVDGNEVQWTLGFALAELLIPPTSTGNTSSTGSTSEVKEVIKELLEVESDSNGNVIHSTTTILSDVELEGLTGS